MIKNFGSSNTREILFGCLFFALVCQIESFFFLLLVNKTEIHSFFVASRELAQIKGEHCIEINGANSITNQIRPGLIRTTVFSEFFESSRQLKDKGHLSLRYK